MAKVPISLIVDDSAPVVSVFYAHNRKHMTRDGRPLKEYCPNSFLDNFCDVVERHGIKGKFSIVPMPGNRGDIVNGVEGVDPALVKEWLDTVRTRLCPNFTVGPEMLTHNKAVDLATGEALEPIESDWSYDQTEETLTPYITLAVQLVKDAGFDVFGVTSPWDFGLKTEAAYAKSIMTAVRQVTGKKNAWFFLRELQNTPNAKPWVELDEDGCCLVSIPGTTGDVIWASINTEDTSDEFVQKRADVLITADGKEGQIIQVLETGGYPVLLTHWQSLFSNGPETGIRILDEVAARINKHLSDRVEWKSFEEIMEMVIADKASYPRPKFDD